MTSLRIVVQHRPTKQFCKPDRTWTDVEWQAMEFANVLDAFNYGSQLGWEDIEIVLRPRRRPRFIPPDMPRSRRLY